METVPSNLTKVRDELERLKVNTSALHPGKTYVIKRKEENGGFLNPYNIKNTCLKELLDFCKNNVRNKKEEKKVEFIEKVLNDEEIQVQDYIPYLYKESRTQIRMFPEKKKEIAQSELEIFLLGDQKRAKKTNSHRNVLKRFKPEIYAFDFEAFRDIINNKSDLTSWQRYIARKNFLIPHTYKLSLTRDKDKLMRAVENSRSCLTRRMVREHCDDAGTLNFILKVDGRVIGYERLFTCVTDKNEPVLALDNLECHNKKFINYTDHVIAMGLAAINLMFDANFKYLIGDEARVSFGLRQAFSNLRRNFDLKKIGDHNIEVYSFYPLSNIEFLRKDAYVLMENWRR
jgi:hypothetical protein